MTSSLGAVAGLRESEFDLDGYVFGGVGTSVELTEWNPGGAEARHQDRDSDAADVRLFGRDRLSPPQWSLTLTIKEFDRDTAIATLAELQQAWENPELRTTPGAVAALRYRIGGRIRRVYGRPRRFTPVLANVQFGRIPVVCDFALAHVDSFADVGQSVELGVGAADLSGTGVTFPVTFPFLWGGTAGDPRSATILVGGARPTPLTATVTGPVVDPYVIVDGAVFQTRGVLAAGEQAVISAAPWGQGISRPDGTTAPLTLAATSRLEQLRVAPGPHLATFGGIDNTGSATCLVSWRDAHVGI